MRSDWLMRMAINISISHVWREGRRHKTRLEGTAEPTARDLGARGRSSLSIALIQVAAGIEGLPAELRELSGYGKAATWITARSELIGHDSIDV